MDQKLVKIVNEFRQNGTVTDKEAEDVYEYCKQKMCHLNIQKAEEYLPLLFEDELRRHVLRNGLNAVSMLQMGERGVIEHVQSVLPGPVRSEMSLCGGI